MTKPLTYDTLLSSIAKMQAHEATKRLMNQSLDSMKLFYGPMPIIKHKDFQEFSCRPNRIFNIGIDFGRAEEKTTMAYGNGYDEGAKMCAEQEVPQKQAKALPPVIDSLVRYAERTGMAEANLENARGSRRQLEYRVEELTCEKNALAERNARLDRDMKYWIEQAQEYANIVEKYEAKERKAKEAAKKAKAKKTTRKAK